MENPDSRFRELFQKPMPLIGKVKLIDKESLSKALEEIVLLSEAGFTSAVIEVHYQFNPKYFPTEGENRPNKSNGDSKFLKQALMQVSSRTHMDLGLNILSYDLPIVDVSAQGQSKKDPAEGENEIYTPPYALAFPLVDLLADVGIKFVHLDYLAGEYFKRPKIDLEHFDRETRTYPEVVKFIGVWPGVFSPQVTSIESFYESVEQTCGRSDAIVMDVMTPHGTPSYELALLARQKCPNKPIIYGYGVNFDNFHDAAMIADGIILNNCLRDDAGKLVSSKLDYARKSMDRIIEEKINKSENR